MRTKEFRIAKRKKKIKERQKLVVQIARHGNVALPQNKHREKVDAAVSGVKPGLFAKHDYGAVTCGKPVKTNAQTESVVPPFRRIRTSKTLFGARSARTGSAFRRNGGNGT